MTNKNYSVSSKSWLKRHYKDQYVQKAKKWNLRSRAWFKLEEIQRNDKIFQPGMTVVDLGAAPGGWSQYVKKQVGTIGRVVACDILSMTQITGVDFIQGDLRNDFIQKSLIKSVGNNAVQVVISDMAPNICGISEIDIPNSMYLVELAIKICRNILIPGGNFLVKVFQGNGFKRCLEQIQSLFLKVKVRKPNSSNTNSKEMYIVAIGHKLY